MPSPPIASTVNVALRHLYDWWPLRQTGRQGGLTRAVIGYDATSSRMDGTSSGTMSIAFVA
jgi:hypothetical protein